MATENNRRPQSGDARAYRTERIARVSRPAARPEAERSAAPGARTVHPVAAHTARLSAGERAYRAEIAARTARAEGRAPGAVHSAHGEIPARAGRPEGVQRPARSAQPASAGVPAAGGAAARTSNRTYRPDGADRMDRTQRAQYSARSGGAAAYPRRMRPKRVVLRTLAVIGVTLLLLVVLLLSASAVICRGPSPAARDLFVTTMMETSAAKFLPKMFFSGEEIAAIQAKNAVVDSGEVTQTGAFEKSGDAVPADTIELLDISGATFKGKMLVVHDPSRVYVAVAPKFGPDEPGVRIEDFVTQENAIAAINGGGFADQGGVGKGGMPLGLVIKNGKVLAGGLSTKSPMVGFDKDNHLVVGTMTGQECLDRGIRDALSFGPTFIVNGKAQDVAGTGGGLNPRTVIGQRADGAVLMLVIDGRQAHSIGATYKDCIDVMLQHGAVNAGNLDGGSSSMLVYDGQVRNVSASLYGSRQLPTAFVVK